MIWPETGELAYFAGAIDARGHISLTSRRGIPQPRVRVTTRRIELLRWLAGNTGVRVKIDDRGYERRPCSEHCSLKHQHLVRQSAYWNVDGARAVIVLWNVLPYLVVQRTTAYAALTDTRIWWKDRTQITAAMERRGWHIPTFDDFPELANTA